MEKVLLDIYLRSKHDKAYDEIFNNDKNDKKVKRTYKLNRRVLEQYIMKMHSEVITAEPVKRYSGVKYKVSTDSEDFVKKRVFWFSHNGISFSDFEKTVVCNYCMIYMDWQSMPGLIQHCKSKEHVENG